jgi:DNA-3-methyladenine glycosylase
MSQDRQLGIEFFDRPTDEVAKALIGVSLIVNVADSAGSMAVSAGGVIVETEAYDQCDPASHTEYKTKNMNKSMYLSAGHIYVYPKSKYCCLNFVCGPYNYGSAVLIRALAPFEDSKPLMRSRRQKRRSAAANNDILLCNGPMNVCQALGIGSEFDGKRIDEVGLKLFATEKSPPISCGSRIGVRDSQYRRYVWTDSPFISHRNEKKYPLTPVFKNYSI